MTSVPKPARVQLPVQSHLGMGVLAANGGHHARQNVQTYRVCHSAIAGHRYGFLRPISWDIWSTLFPSSTSFPARAVLRKAFPNVAG